MKPAQHLYRLLFLLLASLVLSVAGVRAQCFTPAIPCVQYDVRDGVPYLVSNTERLLDYIARNLNGGGGGGGGATATAANQAVQIDQLGDMGEALNTIVCSKSGTPVGLCDLLAQLQAIASFTNSIDATAAELLLITQYEASRNATYHQDRDISAGDFRSDYYDGMVDPQDQFTTLRAASVAMDAGGGNGSLVIRLYTKNGGMYVEQSSYTLDAATPFVLLPNIIADRIQIQLDGGSAGVSYGITYALSDAGGSLSSGGGGASCADCATATNQTSQTELLTDLNAKHGVMHNEATAAAGDNVEFTLAGSVAMNGVTVPIKNYTVAVLFNGGNGTVEIEEGLTTSLGVIITYTTALNTSNPTLTNTNRVVDFVRFRIDGGSAGATAVATATTY